MHTPKLTRRHFFMGSLAAAAWTRIPRAQGDSPNGKLNIACIGCGGRGAADLQAVMRENIVAMCDVDSKRAAEAFERFPDVPKYDDFRVMLDKEHKNIDAVVVATPDHMHAFAAMAAIELGKHVYVEKPMAHSISEARKLTEAARRYKVVTQMGNQGHSFRGVYELEHMVKDGWLGNVTEVHSWTNRPSWPQGIGRPEDTPPVPDGLNWDVWLGPAPERPYHPAYCPRDWRGWIDFGAGALGDMGCHVMDAPFYALGLTSAIRASAEAANANEETFPSSCTVSMEFPARGDMPPVTYTWREAGLLPPIPEGCAEYVQFRDEKAERLDDVIYLGDGKCGSILVGDKAMVTIDTYGTSPRFLDKEKQAEFDASDPPEIRGGNHHKNWIDACKGEGTAVSNFDYAGPLTEAVLMGNLAIQAGEPIEYDPETMKVTNLPEANRFVEREYREGWSLD
jgi:predicted dehydrogenase